MEFQVVTDKRLPEMRIGRSILAFYYRKEMDSIAAGVELRKTDTGQMKVSSVELTVLDLLRYRRAAGGLDNIVTVLSELAPKIDAKRLALLSSSFERPVVQRVGYLLDRMNHRKRAEGLLKGLSRKGSLEWVELEPSENGKRDLGPEPVERDDRWRVIVRRVPESDE
jgi:predicted transcriptional regulator of viral defense system